jgi:BirA family transcriptional regulator, biotin operon repressor / biotin---[acetyl-CoA-carboxylase] ligase
LSSPARITDALHADALNSALQGTIFADKVQIFPSIDSTNTHAMGEAQNGAPHGTVYVAEEQTGGRGRGAHTWHSEPYTGLYLSVVVRPRMVPADALWLSLATGLAVQSAVENVTAMVADIRWPNDLLLGHRKFAGILIEMNAEATRVRYAVAGIGVNVNQEGFPPELSDLATSLRIESDRIVRRQDLLIAILRAMNAEINTLLQPDTFTDAVQGILARIQAKSSWVFGKDVFVDEAGGYTGVTAGLDYRGFLLVRTGAGLRTVLSGGVRALCDVDKHERKD